MAGFCLVKNLIKDNCYGWLLSCKKFLINSWKFVLKIIIEYKNISGGNLILFNVSARNNIPVLMNYIAFVPLLIFEMRRKCY